MPQIQDLIRLWQRSLVAWPDGRRDTTTCVRWLQGREMFVDLRQPTPLPGFPHALSITASTLPFCRGRLLHHKWLHDSVMTWEHRSDGTPIGRSWTIVGREGDVGALHISR